MMNPLLSKILNSNSLYILFGGPSLKGFDLSRLDGRPTLSCNKCGEIYPSSAIISIDATYINSNKKFLKKYNGKVILATRETNMSPEHGARIVDWIEPDYLYWKAPRNRVDESVYMSETHDELVGDNTGHAAVNFAMLHGFKTIHALGLDLKERGHWHSGYSTTQYNSQLERWAQHLDSAKPILDKWGVQLINYNENSAVRNYEFGDLKCL